MRSEIPFSSSRGGGSVRRAINRLMPSAPAKVGAVALVALIVAGVGWAAFSSMRAPAFEVNASDAVVPSSPEPGAVEAKAQVYVYVTGAVANPGVYSLDEGLRVCDAVEAAGGLAEDADASTVNLARVLSDGEHIDLPTKAEVEAALAQGPAGGASGTAVATSLVNINTADASALETLSGVGSATAQAIISDREQNGPFSSIEDLMRVDGIGEKKFAKLKDSICV
ncbi:helix-hairpin-helix domain-containing protein [uncultured Slackia sp.]|uniref:helix-hairpin-helix domain-containing protein n=1 Tax=uncultured Slackia sp. TaxID=665903 RepID=UPI0025882BA7|nr:helix-hairpin-helix domain-containing protein [uncultured Slackia sp.]